MTGTIKEIFRKKPYCIILAQDQTEVFCHENELKVPMKVGARLRFDVMTIPGKHRPEARNVEALAA